jgi:hypothetical protein
MRHYNDQSAFGLTVACENLSNKSGAVAGSKPISVQ